MGTQGESVQRIVEFILELDKLKGVERKTRPLGLDRFENPAEHSWQIAVLATTLAGYAAERVDLQRVVSMLLVHDIGEIDVGDTIVYAQDGIEERKAAEERAAQRICGLLPVESCEQFFSLWQEFEAGKTAEARFAHAVDRATPVILNLANKGQSWRENGIRFEQVVARNGPPIEAGCPALWRHLRARLEAARDSGWFGIQA